MFMLILYREPLSPMILPSNKMSLLDLSGFRMNLFLRFYFDYIVSNGSLDYLRYIFSIFVPELIGNSILCPRDFLLST